jgi:hypothetical protein
MSVASDAGLPDWSKATRAILWGGLMCGVLDISSAFVIWGVRGIGPVRILQSVAAGLLGRQSFEGGFATAALGTVLHFFIAFTACTVYFAVSRKVGLLVQQTYLAGALYGIVVWLVMNLIVLPISAAGRPRFTVSSVATGLIVHVLFVGLPIALAVRWHSK